MTATVTLMMRLWAHRPGPRDTCGLHAHVDFVVRRVRYRVTAESHTGTAARRRRKSSRIILLGLGPMGLGLSKRKTHSWLRMNLMEFPMVWSSSARENVTPVDVRTSSPSAMGTDVPYAVSFSGSRRLLFVANSNQN